MLWLFTVACGESNAPPPAASIGSPPAAVAGARPVVVIDAPCKPPADWRIARAHPEWGWTPEEAHRIDAALWLLECALPPGAAHRDWIRLATYLPAESFVPTSGMSPMPPAKGFADTATETIYVWKRFLPDHFQLMDVLLHEIDHLVHDDIQLVTALERCTVESRAHRNQEVLLVAILSWIEQSEEGKSRFFPLWKADFELELARAAESALGYETQCAICSLLEVLTQCPEAWLESLVPTAYPLLDQSTWPTLDLDVAVARERLAPLVAANLRSRPGCWQEVAEAIERVQAKCDDWERATRVTDAARERSQRMTDEIAEAQASERGAR